MSLSNTIFQSTSTDRVLVTDPSTVKDPATMNIPSDSMKGTFKKVLATIKPSISAAKDIAGIVEMSKYSSVNKLDLYNRALGVMNTSFPAIIAQTDGIVKEGLMGESMSFIKDSLAVSGKIINKGVAVAAKVANATSATGVANLVGELTNNDGLISFVNLEAETAVVAGLLDSVVTAGLPSLVDDVLTISKNGEVNVNAMAWLSTRAINSADMLLLNKTIDVAGPEAVADANPGFASKVTSMFKTGAKSVTELVSEATQVADVINRVDSTWNSDASGLMKMDAFMGASEDFHRVMIARGGTDGIMSMTSKAYDSIIGAPAALIKQQYNDVFIKPGNVTLSTDEMLAQRSSAPNIDLSKASDITVLTA